jgi:hypothetical protein
MVSRASLPGNPARRWRDDPATGGPADPILHGAFVLRDRYGRTRVRGSYLDGVEHGRWTISYGSGRRAASGWMEHGQRTRRWSSWDVDGTVRSSLADAGEAAMPNAFGHPLPPREELIARLKADLASAIDAQRCAAVETCGYLGRDGSDLLVQLLRGTDAYLQVRALHTLAEMPADAQAAVPDAWRLAAGENEMLRIEALFALYELDRPQRPRVLRELLRQSESAAPAARSEILSRLDRLNDSAIP